MSWTTGSLLVLTGLLVFAQAQSWPVSASCEPCKCTIGKEESKRVKYVNCVNLNLKEIPLTLPEDMDVLDLSNNNLNSSQLIDLQEFPQMEFLSLANNNITTLDDSPFSNLAQLTFLKLAGNTIRKLTKKSLAGLTNLNTLRGLKVETVEPQAFTHLQQLKVLELDITGQIPEQLFYGIKLDTLNVTFEKPSELPSNLFDFGTLKDLSITAPKVMYLQQDLLRSLTSLRKICLKLPRLIDMPSNVLNIDSASNKSSSLQEIQLHEITNLPAGLFSEQNQLLILGITAAEELNDNLFDNLISLEVLELKKTFISTIPPKWFAQNNNLVFLSLKETSLRRLDADSFIGLTRLKTLDLSLNSLRVIPKGVFTPMQNSLVHLDLSGNILKNIERGALDGMSSLESLELNDNKMASLQSGLFHHLVHLSSLNLQENKLSSLPDNIFLNQKNLGILNLASNSFSELPQAILQVSKKLISLDLSNNQLHEFGVCTASKFPNLELLSLKSNPLNCNCNLLLLKESPSGINIEGICARPGKFKNKHVATISMPDRCFSEVCDLVEEAIETEPTPTTSLLNADTSEIFNDFFPNANSEVNIKSTMLKIISTSTVVYTSSISPDIAPSMPNVDGQNTHGESIADDNIPVQFMNKLHPAVGASSSPSGASAAASVYRSTEFRSVIGAVAGCLFILMCGVLVYLRAKHQRQTRFTLRQRSAVPS